MKKIIALTLVLILAVGLFAGCKSSDKGSVYFLNFKPEADSAWQALAKTYTEKTGVTVKVVTAASGTYETTLTAEMAKKDAPTLFQCGNETALDTWKDYCLALDGTKFLNEMTTSDFNLKGEDGKTYCAGYCYEAFGIIVNTELLEKAGHSLDEIKDFASLKAVAEDITARKDELGFAAFSSAGLDSSSSWRFSGHLANMPLYYEFRDDNLQVSFQLQEHLGSVHEQRHLRSLRAGRQDRRRVPRGVCKRQGRVLPERHVGIRQPDRRFRHGLLHGSGKAGHDPHLLRR
mgnify:CR=1 FL=1